LKGFSRRGETTGKLVKLCSPRCPLKNASLSLRFPGEPQGHPQNTNSSSPHAHSFVIGPAVIKHTQNRSCSNKTHTETQLVSPPPPREQLCNDDDVIYLFLQKQKIALKPYTFLLSANSRTFALTFLPEFVAPRPHFSFFARSIHTECHSLKSIASQLADFSAHPVSVG
jgi:hypothetical protein